MKFTKYTMLIMEDFKKNFHDIYAKLAKTSPPSPRVAALRYMLQQNWKTKLH